uniref:Predicted nucleic acid-binding protein, contains PIN domain n=1 Tax=Candidatus Kentrum sp. FM TaxID=2126340 RepID=A0A450WL57_9GAMM|nr:MAG: Predicted nucleic acid-binding protein, contains PIN domain [Candidatus Kentron sp. FM]VFJ69052.1 MAG: Predicted nucleic acid-binding protein, contains PIN domain [Candidatus Kentron sp. FM]VFK17772.1 MAG: Predicted nucleic acid-binding protein, contains PIN domain [Candidatus Kentron sp. FM]
MPKGGACGFIVDAWRAGLFTACLSNALAYEYDDVLSRKLSERRWYVIRPLLAELVGNHAEFVTIRFSWRPSSPDGGDEHIIDCAMNTNAPIITSNERDFREAERSRRLKVMTPVRFLEYLVNQ